MELEIERKFLVSGDFELYVTKSYDIAQGFLNTDPERTVRVRLKGDRAFITVKGMSNATGTSRYEWEKEISCDEAEALLTLCEPTIIEKTRHIVPVSEGLYFEVDEFHHDNEGLVLAEIELPDEEVEFEKPEWLGEEVTGNPRYYNSMLSKEPYCKW